MKHKVLSLLLVASMLLSMVAPAAAAESVFADVTATFDAQTYIVTAKASGHGIWERVENAPQISTEFRWNQAGFTSFTNYVDDVISKANAAGSDTIVINGSQNAVSAEIAQHWVKSSIRLRLCAHTNTEPIGAGKEPTCTETGITPGLKCLTCNHAIYPQQVIPFTHRNTDKTEGRPATCTSAGFTAGEVCRDCGKTISVSGQRIPAFGHSWTEDDICRNCGRSRAPGAEIPTYLISIKGPGQSTTTADAHYACAGTLITLTTELADGEELVSITVTDAAGNELDVTDLGNGERTFTIMDSNVTVTVKSGARHAIQVGQGIENGTLDVDYTTAAPGQMVTIRAIPEDGFTADSVTVSMSDAPVACTSPAQNVYTFEMPDGDVTISAVFVAPKAKYQVFTAPADHGTITPDIQNGEEGTVVNVSIEPNLGYKIESIEVVDAAGNRIQSFPNTSKQIRFNLPASNVTIKATFTPSINSVSIGEIVNGTVTVNPQNAQAGSEVVITAIPDKDYAVSIFYVVNADGDTIDSTTEQTLVFTMPESNVTVYVEFEALPPEHEVAIAENPNGSVLVDFEDSRPDSTITFEPDPATGWQMERVTVYLTETPTVIIPFETNDDGTYSFAMPDADVTIDMTFKNIIYSISLLDDEHGAIMTFNGIKSAVVGQMVTVNAIPKAGYVADQLTVINADSDELEDTDSTSYQFENNSCTFEMPASHVTLQATFAELPPEYSVDVDESENGTITFTPDGGSYTAGTSITVTATPNDGYNLSEITVTSADGETEVATSTASPCEFVMPDYNVKVSAEFTPAPVDHKLTITPPAQGGGEVRTVFENTKAGSTITVTAIPDRNYEVDDILVFETESGTEIEYQEQEAAGEFTFVMPDSDVTVTVSFKRVRHAITTGVGITVDHQTAQKNDVIVITVTPEEGFTFVELIVTPEEGSVTVTPLSTTNSSFMFIMPDCPVTISARYQAEEPDYRVTLGSVANGQLTASLSSCKAGTLVTITARPAEGYTVESVSVRTSGNHEVEVTERSGNLFTFTMPESNVEVTATFTAATYSVRPNVVGNGSIRIENTTAVMGQTITVIATPDANHTIDSFTVTKVNGGSVASTRNGNTYTFTMPSSDVVVNVSFTRIAEPTYTITGNTPTNGSLRVSPTTAKAGALITVTATPNAGYVLDQLEIRTASGAEVTTTTTSAHTHTFVMPGEDVSISVRYRSNIHNITLSAASHGRLTASVNRAETGTTVTITAHPDTDYRIASITVTDQAENSIQASRMPDGTFDFTMPDSNVTVSAQFEAVPYYTITKDISVTGGSIVLSTNRAKEGERVTVTPTANTGYRLKSVTIHNTADSSTVSTTNSNGAYTFTMPAGNVSVTAEFEKVEPPKPDYAVTITSPVNGYIQASANKAKAGMVITVTTQPKTGYTLEAISVMADGENVETTKTADNTYTFTMPECSVSITATFTAIPRTITVSQSANGTIETDPRSAVPGSRVTITGTPNAGYELASVSVVGANGQSINVVEAANGQYSFTMPEQAVTVRGAFRAVTTPAISYEIRTADIQHGTVSVSHTKAVAGTTITVNSRASVGYEFESMTITAEDGTHVSGAALGNGAFSFTMPSCTVTVNATFRPITHNVQTTTNEHGAVRVDLSRAAVGDKVIITTVPSNGYITESVSVKTGAGRVITVTPEKDGTFSFNMPAEDVTVTAKFKAQPVMPETYAVTVSAVTEGKVEAIYDSSAEGSKITVKATPNNGYEASGITVTTKTGKTVAVTSDTESGTYSFIMPANDVVIKAVFKAVSTTDKPTFAIVVESSVHGITDLSTTTAVAGTRISITARPDPNYVVNSVTVKDSTGKIIAVSKDSATAYSFTMPNSKASVTVTYKLGGSAAGNHSITIIPSIYGVVVAEPYRASAGDTVSLRTTAYNGYRLNNLTVKDRYGMRVNTYSQFNGVYTFTMPAGDVTVSASFVAAPGPVIPMSDKTVKANVSGSGKIELSCEKGKPGTAVTITAKPDNGCYLGTIRATDTTNSPIPLTKVDENTYRFVLPASDVLVHASFYTIATNPNNPINPGTFVDPNQPTKPVNPGTPIIPDSPFDPIGTNQLPFADVGKNTWFYQDVLYLYQRGVVRGVSGGNFGPNQAVTRGELTTMLYRIAGEPSTTAAMPFTDVAPQAYYANPIAWATSKGYVNGYSTTTFGPNDRISREQLLTILYRYASAQGRPVDVGSQAVLSTFGDASAVSSYAIKAMTWACNAGIIQGSSENLLRPGASASRAEICAILHRFCEKYPTTT